MSNIEIHSMFLQGCVRVTMQWIHQLPLPFSLSYTVLHLQPVVLFAGEHTHSSFYSTVHGAFLTGRSAAQVLLSYQSPQELVMECQGTSDLSSWIQGISLDWAPGHEMGVYLVQQGRVVDFDCLITVVSAIHLAIISNWYMVFLFKCSGKIL